MTYSLRLFLAGLVALVKDRDGSLHFLLPHAAHGHHAHFPVLLCDPDNADCRLSAASEGGQIARHLRTGPPLTGYLLAGEELTVHGAASGEIEAVAGRWRRRWYHDVVGTVPGSHEECADSAWIAPMRAIDPLRATVAPRHLQRPRREAIAAKLTLAGCKGTLRAFHMSEVCERVVSLTFKRPSTRMPMRTFRQAVADTAVFELTADQPVRFELSPFAGDDEGARAAARTLTVAPKEGAQQVDVLLANLSPLQEPFPCGAGFVPPPGLHFEMYYQLSATPAPPWEWMLPVPHAGFRSVPAARLRPAWPPVLEAVGQAGGDALGSYERPICTLAFFEVDLGG